MSRNTDIAAFLDACGWGDGVRVPLAGDASARRYERVVQGTRAAILMDVAPESGLSVGPFLAVDRWLRAAGLSAPEVLGADGGLGLVLLEDLGDDLFARICADDPGRAEELYGAAVDLLADMQRLPPPFGPFAPPDYDMAILMREVRLAVEWYMPAATGQPVPAAFAAAYDAAAEAVLTPYAVREVVVYRDYHAENLLWLPEREGLARVGLLDFQDMLMGHPAYDLVSLLRDARRDVDPDFARAMQARYVARTGVDREAFEAAARVLSAQRNLKIIGLFARLALRDGKRRYLEYLPRVWGYLMEDLAHPAVAPLADLVMRHMPAPEAVVVARIEAAA